MVLSTTIADNLTSFTEIKKMVKNTEPPLSDAARKEIEAKLEHCRNQQNNPNSSQYRANYSEWDDEDLPIASSPFSGDVSMGVERIRSPSAYWRCVGSCDYGFIVEESHWIMSQGSGHAYQWGRVQWIEVNMPPWNML